MPIINSVDHSNKKIMTLEKYSTTKALIASLRPKQWSKNLIVFCPLFFSAGEAWSLNIPALALTSIGKTMSTFLIFCALSSAVYLINDIIDIDRDSKHYKKRFRPIASKNLPIFTAWISSAILGTSGLILSFIVEPLLGIVSASYLTLILGYSVILKNFMLIDAFAIAGGFVLRAVAGAAVLQAPVSPWLYTCTGLGALLITFLKRRSELSIAGDNACIQRETLGKYTLPLLDQFIAIVATAVLLAYTLYTFTAPNLPENSAMMLSIPFVTYSLFRYIYLAHSKNLGENPENIFLSDPPLLVSIALWLATVSAVLIAFRG